MTLNRVRDSSRSEKLMILACVLMITHRCAARHVPVPQQPALKARPKGKLPMKPQTHLAPADVRSEMPDPTIELCDDCIDAYRNGIEPGETACECRARGEITEES